MIIVSPLTWWKFSLFGRPIWVCSIKASSLYELHSFVSRLGVEICGPTYDQELQHYRLTEIQRQKAIELGAESAETEDAWRKLVNDKIASRI